MAIVCCLQTGSLFVCIYEVVKMAEAIETALLKHVNDHGDCKDSGEFATALGVDHLAVVGVIKSLQASEMIVAQVNEPSINKDEQDLQKPAPAAATHATQKLMCFLCAAVHTAGQRPFQMGADRRGRRLSEQWIAGGTSVQYCACCGPSYGGAEG